MGRPTQAHLDKMFAKAKRIRVIDAGTRNGKLDDFTSRGRGTLETLLEVAPADFAAFRAVFQIATPEDSFYCMCRGWPVVEIDGGFLRKYRFGLHHGGSVRFDGWDSDAPLANGRALVEWLAAHGVAGPLEDVKQAELRDAEMTDHLARWRAAMPPCLVPLGDAAFAFLMGDGEQALYMQAREALAAAYPNPAERVMALVRWYGSGAGPWSGYPAYESLPEKLLREHPIEKIVEIVAAVETSTVELEGTARLVAVRRPSSIPAALRAKLVAHVEDHAIEDCKQRFAAATGS